MLETMLRLCLLLLLLLAHQTTLATNSDPKSEIRLNEIHLNIAWLSSYTSFTFVELFAPGNAVVDLTGLTVVFYSAKTMSQFAYCPCDGISTNNLGYGSCNCGLGGIKTNVDVGAIALHNVPSSVFKNTNFTAEQAVNLNMTDVVLYQTYGALTNNSLQELFTPGQVCRYVPPLQKTVYSIVRCYGDPEVNAKWQASFSWVYTATQNAPNLCPVPYIYINEIHLNSSSYIELSSVTPELPLDEVTLAIIVDNETSVVVVNTYPLTNQRLESNTLFTIGSILGADVLTNLNLPTNRPTVVALYFNVTVAPNTTALTTNLTSSIVYSSTAEVNRKVPPNLAPFGKEMYPIDASGRCSISVCGNQSDIRSATPSPTTPNNCTIACSLNVPQATVRLSEVHSNVAWAGSQVTFTFVEVYTPLGSIDLTGLTVVFYFAYDLNSWNCCSCNGIRTNDQGYALCNCGPKGIQRIPADVAYQGAITLQLVDASFFANPVPASLGSQLNVIDSILYQSFGLPDDTNPLKPYFAPGQHFVIPPPVTQSAFSTDRCYGDPLTTGKWQASFRSIFIATPNAPNPCPPPVVNINEIHFNTDFVQLFTIPEELPLDQVTLAYVSELGIITNNFSLIGQRVDYTRFFSIGNYSGVDLKEEIDLPHTTGTTGLVVYFNISISPNQQAPVTNFLSSVLYSESSTTIPDNLAPFGNETFLIDVSGKCALGACSEKNETDMQSITPSIGVPINCTTMEC